MKLAISGDFLFFSLSSSFKRAFESLNVDIACFNDRESYERANPFNDNKNLRKLANKIFFKFFIRKVQDDFIDFIKQEKPDLLLVIKGWYFFPETIKKIKKLFPKLLIFNFNPDNPFNTWHKGSSNDLIRNSIPFYDVYFIWGKFLIEPLRKAGARRVEYLPFAWDPFLRQPAGLLNEDEQEHFGSDVVFVGSWDKERERILSRLLGYDLKIWGSSWQKANSKLQSAWTKKAEFGKNFCKIIKSSKIVLNLIRKQNPSSVNMRTFEIPACRGFMLSTRTEESLQFFQEGKEAEYFSDYEELKEKIDFYLKHDDLRKQIAENAYRKVLSDESYTYKDRAKKILEVYNKLKNT